MPIPVEVADASRKSLRVVAGERIRAAIFDGTLEPGEHLNDAELQGWLGISRTPIREALNDLARVGLVEMAAQKYTRVVAATPELRTEILQTVGALVGGVVRVTVPTLSEERRRVLEVSLEELLVATAARDAASARTRGWAVVDSFVDECPNQTLVQATRDMIGALAYKLSITHADESADWDVLDDGYPRLLMGVRNGDAIAAELAVETIFHL
ncbi:GntR family transcriptional regulator [Plantibacter sp. RU18]|uniref:GntR family transcriptional regulator n=1 Tax=Plantibacter sp. RU18 TaxID=3158143 RepID=UPI003D36564B